MFVLRIKFLHRRSHAGSLSRRCLIDLSIFVRVMNIIAILALPALVSGLMKFKLVTFYYKVTHTFNLNF